MADAANIIERIRANGANIIVDHGKLRIINRHKLPTGAAEFIRQNARAVAAFLDNELEFETCAKRIEFNTNAPREWARQFADILINQKPEGVDEVEWSWFITRCGQIIDEAPAVDQTMRRAA